MIILPHLELYLVLLWELFIKAQTQITLRLLTSNRQRIHTVIKT